MKEHLEPFDSQDLEDLASIAAEVFTATEIVEHFKNAGYTEFTYGGGTVSDFVLFAFQTLQMRKGPADVLKIMKTMYKPLTWNHDFESHKHTLEKVNKVLRIHGLELTGHGSYSKLPDEPAENAPQAQSDEALFDSRNFHPTIVKYARDRFCRGEYYHAVYFSCLALEKIVRENTKIKKSGKSLFAEALSLHGILKVNRQQDKGDEYEQIGIRYLCMGLASAVNKSKEDESDDKWPMTKDDAIAILTLVSYLLGKIEKSYILDSASQMSYQVRT